MSQELELPRLTRIYPSKRDPWLVLLLVLVQTACIVSAIRFLMRGPSEIWIGFLFIMGSFLVGWILAGTYYCIETDRLQIRCGCFRWEIPLESVQRVSPRSLSRRTSFISYGAALSLDGIRIVWKSGSGTREIMISPMELDEFLSDLTLVAPWIEVDRNGS